MNRYLVFAAAAIVATATTTSANTFILAQDTSQEPMFSCYGTCSPYKMTATSAPQDIYTILKSCGINTIRLRVWVSPSAHASDGDERYANLTSVLRSALRVQAAGLALWIDFHYSDTWADPSHQTKPAAWVSLSMTALANAVSNHTTAVLTALAAQNTPPAIVQIGNEISAGMLWAPSGQPCNTGGYVGSSCNNNWPNLALLFSAGARATRAVIPTARIMVHTDLGNRLSTGAAGVKIINDYYHNFATVVNDSLWDLIGLSYYTKWGAGHTDSVLLLSGVQSAFPTKPIVLAETAYPWGGQAPSDAEFPYTQAGQAEYIQTLLSKSHAVNISGLAWWGGESYAHDTGAGQTAVFDRQAVALPVITNGWS